MSDIGNKEIFAKNLSFYMDKKKVDRYKLCDDLDFKYSTLSEWLSAKKYPRIDKIEKLANYFEIPKSALIEQHPLGTDDIMGLRNNTNRKSASLARLENNELTPDEDKQISDFIDFMLNQRKNKE